MLLTCLVPAAHRVMPATERPLLLTKPRTSHSSQLPLSSLPIPLCFDTAHRSRLCASAQIIEPALRFGTPCSFNRARQLHVTPRVLYEATAFAVDEAGRPRESGGEQTKVLCTCGPGPLAADVYDRGDGSYKVLFAVQARLAFNDGAGRRAFAWW